VRKCIILFLLISLFNILSSCSDLGFYWQATKGHLSLLNKKKNIQDLIDAPDTPAELKRKLKLVESTKSFANQYLTISLNEAYTGYVELERSYVTLVVTAAKPLELKSYQWCYLFIGCQEYRGFFIESEAKLFASKMISENLDVSIRPVTAYSTLGWLNKPWLPDYFSDPVLSTFLMRHDADLISTLFHEMAHKIVFVKNDTTFNESFAVFVEQEALSQFLDLYKNTDLFNENWEKIFSWYLNARDDRALFRELIENTYNKMEVLFSSKIPTKEKIIKKQQLFFELYENYLAKKKNFQILSYDKWFEKKLNNTHLLGVKRYNSKVQKFAKLFENNGKEWPAFFKSVRDLAYLSKKERDSFMDSLN
tara:strand:+ start:10265 stop:11359 length:1095 start_codon:yes stop_codon:yes gene_type:complete